MKRLALPFALACVVVLSACGTDPGPTGGSKPVDPNAPTNTSGVQVSDASGKCSQQTISDYNEVMLECNYMYSDQSKRDCKSTAQSFVVKYPNLNCMAQKSSSSSVNDAVVSVNNDEINDLIRELTAKGY